MKKILSIALIFILSFILFIPAKAEAATVKLNKSNISIRVGETEVLKLSGVKNKIAWSSNKKTIATVSSSGKVTAKKEGSAVITAKVNNKSYKCNVTVDKKHSKLYSEFENAIGENFTLDDGTIVNIYETDGKTVYDVPSIVAFDYSEIVCIVEGVRTVDKPGNKRYIIIDFSLMNLTDSEISSSDVYLTLQDSNQYVYTPTTYNYDDQFSPIGDLNNFAKSGDIVRGEVCFEVKYNTPPVLTLRYDIERDTEGRASFKIDLSRYENQYGEVSSTIKKK